MENTKCSGLLLRWMPLVLYAGLIYYLSSLSQPRVLRFPDSDKVYHAVLYSGLGLLFVRAFSARKAGWSAARILEVAVSGAVAYGLTDEFHQIFVAGRSPGIADLVADGIGGLLGGTLYLIIAYAQRRLRKRKIPDDSQTLASR